MDQSWLRVSLPWHEPFPRLQLQGQQLLPDSAQPQLLQGMSPGCRGGSLLSLQPLQPSFSSSPPQGPCVAAPPSPSPTLALCGPCFSPVLPTWPRGSAVPSGGLLELAVPSLGHPQPLPSPAAPLQPLSMDPTHSLHCWHTSELLWSSSSTVWSGLRNGKPVNSGSLAWDQPFFNFSRKFCIGLRKSFHIL